MPITAQVNMKPLPNIDKQFLKAVYFPPNTLSPKIERELSVGEKIHIPFLVEDYPIAFCRSSIKSSASSIPTLSRISESDNPFLILSSRGIDACVIVAG